MLLWALLLLLPHRTHQIADDHISYSSLSAPTFSQGGAKEAKPPQHVEEPHSSWNASAERAAIGSQNNTHLWEQFNWLADYVKKMEGKVDQERHELQIAKSEMRHLHSALMQELHPHDLLNDEHTAGPDPDEPAGCKYYWPYNQTDPECEGIQQWRAKHIGCGVKNDTATVQLCTKMGRIPPQPDFNPAWGDGKWGSRPLSPGKIPKGMADPVVPFVFAGCPRNFMMDLCYMLEDDHIPSRVNSKSLPCENLDAKGVRSLFANPGLGFTVRIGNQYAELYTSNDKRPKRCSKIHCRLLWYLYLPDKITRESDQMGDCGRIMGQVVIPGMDPNDHMDLAI